MVTSLRTLRTTPQRRPLHSTLRSSSSTTLVRSVPATPPFSTATLPTLLASSPSSLRRSIVVPVRPSRPAPSSSSLAMPALPSLSPPSPCVLRSTTPTHHLVVSPSVTCVRPSPSVSSSPSTRPTRPVARVRRAPCRVCSLLLTYLVHSHQVR